MQPFTTWHYDRGWAKHHVVPLTLYSFSRKWKIYLGVNSKISRPQLHLLHCLQGRVQMAATTAALCSFGSQFWRAKVLEGRCLECNALDGLARVAIENTQNAGDKEKLRAPLSLPGKCETMKKSRRDNWSFKQNNTICFGHPVIRSHPENCVIVVVRLSSTEATLSTDSLKEINAESPGRLKHKVKKNANP